MAKQSAYCIGAGLAAKERDHSARIEDKDHDLDSRARSSLFRLMNDSLDVGTLRYLPLIAWTSSLRLAEIGVREVSKVANASISSLRCSVVKLRTASTID